MTKFMTQSRSPDIPSNGHHGGPGGIENPVEALPANDHTGPSVGRRRFIVKRAKLGGPVHLEPATRVIAKELKGAISANTQESELL